MFLHFFNPLVDNHVPVKACEWAIISNAAGCQKSISQQHVQFLLQTLHTLLPTDLLVSQSFSQLTRSSQSTFSLTDLVVKEVFFLLAFVVLFFKSLNFLNYHTQFLFLYYSILIALLPKPNLLFIAVGPWINITLF